MHHLLYGEVVTTLLGIIVIIWCIVSKKSRGLLLFLLASLCAGTVVNAVVNIPINGSGASKTIIFYVILTTCFTWWGFSRRKIK